MPVCFVIGPIGLEGSPTRDRSDQLLDHVITPIAKECGFDALRADKISEPGLITTQVIDHILNDPMVVADLTGNNANVFYELAIRHAIRKPYVQLIQKGERIPFDVAGVRTVEIDHTNLDSVATAKEEIRKQMLFTTENPTKIESPISVAIDFEKLRKSDDPGQRQLADILNGIAGLSGMLVSRMDVMSRQLGDIISRQVGNVESAWISAKEQLSAPRWQATISSDQELKRMMAEEILKQRKKAREAQKEGTPGEQKR